LKCRVVVTNAASRFRSVRFGDQVAHLGVVTEGLESVSESLWNVELAAVDRRKLELLPAAKSRRIRSDIDDDIENGASGATYQFNFAVRIALIMHAAQCSHTSRTGNAVLWETGFQPVSSKFIRAEAAGKEAALVACRIQFNQNGIAEVCRVKLQAIVLSVTSKPFGATKYPSLNSIAGLPI
jgi:hypothetical protein